METQQAKAPLIWALVASLGSGLLLAFSLSTYSILLTAFFAFIPLLWLSRRQSFWPFVGFSILSNLLTYGLLAPEAVEAVTLSMGLFSWAFVSLLFSIPWAMLWLIHHRHNAKLGYWAFVSSYLALEWMQGQFSGHWAGWQLGSLPLLFGNSWQALTVVGTGGASLWILSLNIQLFRFLFPAQAKSRKGAIWAGIPLLLLPFVLSLFMGPGQKGDSGSFTYQSTYTNQKGRLLLGQAPKEEIPENALYAQEKTLNDWAYLAGQDSLGSLRFWQKGERQQLSSQAFSVRTILGVEQRFFQFIDWQGSRLLLLNAHSLNRTAPIREGLQKGAQTVIAFSPDSSLSPILYRSARARAQESGSDIILVQNKKAHHFLANGDYQALEDGQSCTPKIWSPTFFAQYGDLPGRLSIFLAAWLALASIVKPFRKK
ncbi:hypothetical protein SapgrDRAFT_2382 [Saprospira grandis DSM 2844]|uniref:Apolipoprotein N-acyltransferase n=1 Tax=Saprospira grandis DSM 2844 TaxID=694433 RepID=J1I6N1_9BACT|nr:hypothetical protein [Saprospira grandis]EJF54048.1 hypothetical protein SapgrDRAFT_2382 [Saprospira grandis DSM 2844]